MTRKELSLAVAEELLVNNAEADRAVEATIRVIKRALEQGKEVSIRGFGKFELRRVPERKYCNLINNCPFILSQHLSVTFKPCEGLKMSVRDLNHEEVDIG